MQRKAARFRTRIRSSWEAIAAEIQGIAISSGSGAFGPIVLRRTVELLRFAQEEAGEVDRLANARARQSGELGRAGPRRAVAGFAVEAEVRVSVDLDRARLDAGQEAEQIRLVQPTRGEQAVDAL